MQYESLITSGKEVMAKVKVFVHTHMPTPHGRGHQGYDIRSPDIRPGSLKRLYKINLFLIFEARL